MIYGKGDHMRDHLSHVFYTLPLFALVGFKEQYASPLAIEAFIKVLEAALLEERLSRKTFAIIGPERITLKEAVNRVAKTVGKTPIMFPMPVFFHYGLATLLETLMKIPLVSIAQVRILAEGFDQSYGDADQLPTNLQPQIAFTEIQISKGLPKPGSFGLRDLRYWRKCL
jgi:NADH dehydrogenase